MSNPNWEVHNPIVDKIYNFTINVFIRISPKEGTLTTWKLKSKMQDETQY